MSSLRNFNCPATGERCDRGGCLVGKRCMIEITDRLRDKANRLAAEMIAKQERWEWLEAHPDQLTLADLMDDE